MSEQLWIWRHFRFDLPADWELLQYSRDPMSGRCAFADRYAFRFELSWRGVSGPPDFERMMSDYAARLAEQGYRRLHPERWRNWHGIAAEWEERPVVRFGGYFDGESCVVECVFLGADRRDRALEERVLGSFSEVAPDAAGRRRWRALGLDLRVHGDLRFAECRADPGEVEWVFQDERRRRAVRCRRIGLRPVWMRQSVADWLRAATPPLRAAGEASETVHGHVIFRRWGRQRRGVLENLWRGPEMFAAEAWVCPADDRLYLREVRGPRRFVEEESRGGALRCVACEGAAS